MGQHEQFMELVSQPLSYEDVVAWAESKWGADRQCPYCEVSDWLVDVRQVDLPYRGANTPTPPFSAMPIITVTCGNCAQAVFLREDQVLAYRNADHRKRIFGE